MDSSGVLFCTGRLINCNEPILFIVSRTFCVSGHWLYTIMPYNNDRGRAPGLSPPPIRVTWDQAMSEIGADRSEAFPIKASDHPGFGRSPGG